MLAVVGNTGIFVDCITILRQGSWRMLNGACALQSQCTCHDQPDHDRGLPPRVNDHFSAILSPQSRRSPPAGLGQLRSLKETNPHNQNATHLRQPGTT